MAEKKSDNIIDNGKGEKFFTDNSEAILSSFKELQLVEMLLKLKIADKKASSIKSFKDNMNKKLAKRNLGYVIGEFEKTFIVNKELSRQLEQLRLYRNSFMHIFYLITITKNGEKIALHVLRELDKTLASIIDELTSGQYKTQGPKQKK